MPQFYDFQREILNKLFSALSGGDEVEAKCATTVVGIELPFPGQVGMIFGIGRRHQKHQSLVFELF